LTQETHALLQDLPHDSEVEIVIEVQFICRMVKGNAKRLGDFKNSQKTDDGVLTFERGRYLAQKEKALELARTITDIFYRATAFRHIIALCMRAKDNDAKDLLKEVGVPFILEKIFEAHPELRSSPTAKTS
jgi:hypothetical protein